VNILLVEDHTDTRRVLSSLLGRSGHEIVTAQGITDALQLLAHIQVNVLLSDLGLADGDGLDLVAKAKALQPRIQAIALTARGSEKDYEIGKKAGFDHYLTKPFDFHELRTLLNVVRDSSG
jgi:DNA-binding response OmpR family regulator